MFEAKIYLYTTKEGGRRGFANRIFTPQIQFFESSSPPLRLNNGKLFRTDDANLFDVRILVKESKISLGVPYYCELEFLFPMNDIKVMKNFLICEFNHVVGKGEIVGSHPGQRLNYERKNTEDVTQNLIQFLSKIRKEQNL